MSTNSEKLLPVLSLFFFEDELIRTRYGNKEAHVGGRSEGCFEFLPGVRALVCLVLYCAARAVPEESETGSKSIAARSPEGHLSLFGGPESLVGTFRNLKGKKAPGWLDTIFGRNIRSESIRIEDLVNVAKPRDSKTAQQSRPVSLTREILDPERVEVFTLPEPNSVPREAMRITVSYRWKTPGPA